MDCTFQLATPANFDFWKTVFSHGWCTLPPFRVDKEHETLERVVELADGSLVHCSLSDSSGRVHVRGTSPRGLSSTQQQELEKQLQECLRLGEDFSEFYRVANRFSRFRWIPKLRVGRLLRCPTVFEDTVKIICTTNCSWSLTQSMVRNLTGELGKNIQNGGASFPSPQAIAEVSEPFLRKNIRAGYRSPYLLELAERVAGGRLAIESWRSSPLTTGELFKQVRGIKGIGDYAAGNLLRLLGRYDYLALDSWVRTQYFKLHHRGRRVGDKTIEKAFGPFGQWRGLFFWLEMTKEWITHKFPF